MANCSRKKSLHHLFQVINNNVFKTTFPLDHHHCHFECHDRDYTKLLTIMRNSSVKLLLPLLLQSNIILHNLDLRLNHAISIIHKIWLLPKSLHICICHRRRGKRLSSSSFVASLLRERKSGIYSRKNAEKQLSECKFMEKQLFGGIEFYHAKLYYTISKMSKNGK